MTLAEQVAKSFRRRFWRPELGHLADVVDGPAGDDVALRPNQVFALSLHFALLEGDQARSTLDAVGRSLHASYGLRTLAPDDPAYLGPYGGDRQARDGAYHQGTAWAWLMGAYAEAIERVTGDRAAALSVLRPFEAHLADAGPGLDLGDLRRRRAPPAARLPRPGVVRGRGPAGLAPARPGVAGGPAGPRTVPSRRTRRLAVDDRQRPDPEGHQRADRAHRREERLAARPGGHGHEREQPAEHDRDGRQADPLDPRPPLAWWLVSRAPAERRASAGPVIGSSPSACRSGRSGTSNETRRESSSGPFGGRTIGAGPGYQRWGVPP